MSWSCNRTGRADSLTQTIKGEFAKTQGAPHGSQEEFAKNQLGEVARILCASLTGNPAVRIEASGSAWNEGGKAKHQQCSFKFETLLDFID